METEFDEIDRGPEESEVAVLEGHLTSLEKRGESLILHAVSSVSIKSSSL